MTSASPSLRIRWSSRRSDVPRPADRVPGEHALARESEPDLLEAVELVERGSVANAAPLSAPAEVPTIDVGQDAALEQGAEHPDLCDSLVTAARQHEGGHAASRELAGRARSHVLGTDADRSLPRSDHAARASWGQPLRHGPPSRLVPDGLLAPRRPCIDCGRCPTGGRRRTARVTEFYRQLPRCGRPHRRGGVSWWAPCSASAGCSDRPGPRPRSTSPTRPGPIRSAGSGSRTSATTCTRSSSSCSTSRPCSSSRGRCASSPSAASASSRWSSSSSC